MGEKVEIWKDGVLLSTKDTRDFATEQAACIAGIKAKAQAILDETRDEVLEALEMKGAVDPTTASTRAAARAARDAGLAAAAAATTLADLDALTWESDLAALTKEPPAGSPLPGVTFDDDEDPRPGLAP